MFNIMLSGDIIGSINLPFVPRVGEYIEYGPQRAFCVKSVHYQGSYAGAMLVVESTPTNVYAMIRGEK
jgi:hypothetical protein